MTLAYSLHAQKQKYIFSDSEENSILPNREIRYILQDDIGYLWFCTNNGLYRYDGHDLIENRFDVNDTSSLSNNSINLSLQNSKGEIWIAGLRFVSLLNRENFSFLHFWSESDFKYFTPRQYTFDNEDNIWMLSFNQIARFNTINRNWKKYSLEFQGDETFKKARFIFIDNNQNLWLGIKEKLYYGTISNGNNIHFKTYRIKNNEHFEGINYIWEDKDNALWLSTTNGLFYKNKANSFFERISFNNQLHSLKNDVGGVNSDLKDNIWIRTRDTIYIYNSLANSLKTIATSAIGRIDNMSNWNLPVFHDNSGSHWVNINDKGIIKISEVETYFTHIMHHPDDLNSITKGAVFSIFEDDKGILWIGTKKGLNSFNPEKNNYTRYTFETNNTNSLSGNDVLSINQSKNGNILIGTRWSGLNMYDKNKKKFYHFVEKDNDSESLPKTSHYRYIFRDSKNRLWVLHMDGVSLLKENERSFKNYTLVKRAHSQSEDHLFSIVEDNEGKIWVGGSNKIFKINPDNDEVVAYEVKTVKHNITGLHFFKKTNSLFIGTLAEGMISFDIENEEFTNITKKDGLPSNIIYCFLEDKNNNLWISTSHGISKYIIDKKKFINFDKADGLEFDDFSTGAFLYNSSGKMLFGGESLVIFDPDSIKKIEDKYNPPLIFTSIKVNGKNKYFNQDIAKLERIELSTKDNYFEISFSNLDFRYPDNRKYKYKLEGYDKSWKTPEMINSANYSNLKVGEYIFHAKATNSRGYWNNNDALLKIDIKPSKITEELWFLPLLWIFIISVIIFFAIMFMRNRIKKEKEKNQKIKDSLEHQAQLASLQALRSQMNPHFLYNVLNSVNSFISENDITTANSFLVDFGKLMRNILDNSKQHIVLLEKSLQFIKLYLDFEHLRFGDKFDYKIDIDKSVNTKSLFIPTMLLQPFLENAIKHGFLNKKEKGLLYLHIYCFNGSLICIIKDNGIGRKKSQLLKSNSQKNIDSTGISNIIKRIELLKNIYNKKILLKITDEYNTKGEAIGTVVKIVIENPKIWQIL